MNCLPEEENYGMRRKDGTAVVDANAKKGMSSMKNRKTGFLSLLLMLLFTLSVGIASAAPPDDRPPNNRPPSGGPPDNRPPDNRPPGKGGGGPPPVEVCGDGIDNDNDGQIDEGCEPPPVEVCGDGIDNDNDGQIDEGCEPPPVEVCGDGIDNDNDGQIDEGCEPPPVEVCGDGIDNDNDGQIDEGCPSGNLVTGKLDRADPVPVGGQVDWIILAGNVGSDVVYIPEGTVLVVDYLPATVSNVSVAYEQPGYDCEVSTNASGNPIVECTALIADFIEPSDGTEATLRFFEISAAAPNAEKTLENTVEADPDGVIAEANENDNTWTETTTVTA